MGLVGFKISHRELSGTSCSWTTNLSHSRPFLAPIYLAYDTIVLTVRLALECVLIARISSNANLH